MDGHGRYLNREKVDRKLLLLLTYLMSMKTVNRVTAECNIRLQDDLLFAFHFHSVMLGLINHPNLIEAKVSFSTYINTYNSFSSLFT